MKLPIKENFTSKTNTYMQALTQIGFTEKDFELAFKLIEKATKSNKIFGGETTIEVEFGITDPFGRILANQIQQQLRKDGRMARQQNEDLVELQYKMIQLKRLIAQVASRESMG